MVGSNVNRHLGARMMYGLSMDIAKIIMITYRTEQLEESTTTFKSVNRSDLNHLIIRLDSPSEADYKQCPLQGPPQ